MNGEFTFVNRGNSSWIVFGNNQLYFDEHNSLFAFLEKKMHRGSSELIANLDWLQRPHVCVIVHKPVYKFLRSRTACQKLVPRHHLNQVLVRQLYLICLGCLV